jgi:hypothetical protein
MKFKKISYYFLAMGLLLIGIWIISVSRQNPVDMSNDLSTDSVIREKKIPLNSEDSSTFRHSNSAQEIWDKQFNNNKALERAAEDIPLSPDGKIKSAVK